VALGARLAFDAGVGAWITLVQCFSVFEILFRLLVFTLDFGKEAA